ncbi:tetratricopeptide repeat protein (macronuclear) [Tetrahymena thermophila SB210]|uniref:Tetratricopeptide repeat protein n=1 Tax=Tetrahymena thermophila (strain SB210) TaxID=312017 RepID=Q245U3_TETTS|nr:tetratricopeptide repeat protein [Tetrahymena thermophila SB210]EAS03540.1 tetratricopeptide repeat protein [Tetrahymena thermophila SB210]|eukprot:XP_001023785.1 tetratricopeptide repeat protein [Tetrahymena thermophila SB210]
MGQGIGCSFGVDQALEVKEMLLKLDEIKHYEKMKTYKGIKSIYKNLPDLMYRLYPKNFEDFSRIMASCKQLQTPKNFFFSQLVYAICLIQLEDYSKGEDILNGLILRYPTFSHPYFYLGNIQLIKDSRKNASEFYQQCIKVDPSNNEAMLLLEQCKIKFFDPLYDDILEKPPNLQQEVKQLELIAHKINKEDKKCFQAFHIISSNYQSQSSIVECNKYLKMLPNCYGANIKKGQIFMTRYDFDNARSCFEKAMELKPHSWVPLSSFAIIYYIQNELEKSLHYCNRIIESQATLNESNKRALQIAIKIKILCLQALGRVDESLNVCNTNLQKSNYEKDFLLLKNQILVIMEKYKMSQIVQQQIEIQMKKQAHLRTVQLMLYAYEKSIKDHMTMNPKELTFDLHVID